MLTTQWNATAQGGALPTIREKWNVKATGLGDDIAEEIIIEPLSEKIETFALFGQAHKHELPIKIDIRSFVSVTRHNQIVKEVSRIIKNSVRRDQEGFIDIRVTGNDSFTSDLRNMFRDTFNIIYRDVDDVVFI